MNLLNLFEPGKKFKRVVVPRKDVFLPEPEDELKFQSSEWNLPNPEDTGTEYVQKYIEEENAKALEAVKLINQISGGAIDEISVGTVPTTADVENEAITKIYNQYDFEYRPKDDLPIFDNKEEIVSTVQTHSVTVIQGMTGCGKSTQVPQFILDSSKEQRKHCNIIVTQPRRIAALSIANRVCQERDWQLGSIIGVQVGMYRNVSPDTRLTYCTTGVLLRKLITAKNMLEYTHIILDEVHERDQEMDFLLLVIRKLLRSNSRQVKIVLMSATINVEKFAQYFATPTETGFIPAPIISVGKKAQYKVHKYYLCQLDILGSLPEVEFSEPKITEKMMTFAIKLINVFDQIDNESEYDDDDLKECGGQKPSHAVLVFLPGIWEIEEMHGQMVMADEKVNKWDIVVLHSSITGDEQNKIFHKPPKGKRRIILATNLAESSITIDDVKYVVDFCLTKQLEIDIETNYQCLKLTWASQANCEQRAGRAGRVMDGRVYRLMPKKDWESLPDEGSPEITRAPLENLVLQTKLLDMGEPRAVLALAMDPPDLSNLESTILLLKEAGGLINKPNDYKKFDGEITDLGQIMAALPINIHLSKMIALGHVFNVLRDTIIMAAAMGTKSMFNNPFQKRMEAYEAKIHWAEGSSSDSLAMLNAYNVWYKEILSGNFKKKSANEKNWARRHFIQIRVLHEVDYLVHELTQRLELHGIKETSGPNKIIMSDMDRFLFLKIVIAGAFYPNYFIRNDTAKVDGDDTGGAKALGGLDPTRSVSLTGWKQEQPGKLYAKRIQEIFEPVTPLYQQILVEFDGTSRIFIMFPDDKKFGNEKKQSVSLTVYKALKMRQLRTDMTISVLNSRNSLKLAEEYGITGSHTNLFYTDQSLDKMRSIMPTTVPHLPPVKVSEIPVKIVNFINPNKFWIHYLCSNTTNNKPRIEKYLNDSTSNTLTPISENDFKIGGLVAARGKDNKLCRVVIESCSKVKNEDVAQVYFIDYGYRQAIRKADMKEIDKNHVVYKMPALAIECTLAHIEPSKRFDPDGFWTEGAKKFFQSTVHESSKVYNKLDGKIFSIYDSVISLELMVKTNEQKIVSLNDLLIEKEYASRAEESYLSKYNHDLRLKAQNWKENEAHPKYLEYLQYDRNFLIMTYPEPPPLSECRSEIKLKGPFSPLELGFASLAMSTESKRVSVCPQSVNSIILNMESDDDHERLLVAGIVTQSPSQGKLTLRDTTLLPNLPGLTTLICLLFSPRIELRRNKNGSHYIGALCGLGYHPKTNRSLLPKHDMNVHFETEVTIGDMQMINRMRHYMNLGISVKKDENYDEYAIICQKKLYDFLKKWLDSPKKPQKVIKLLKNEEERWKYYDEELFMPPKETAVMDDSIFPLHSALLLEDRNEEKEDLADHLNELRELSISDIRMSENIEATCKLCNVTVYQKEELRIHLYMTEHRNKVARLYLDQ